LTKDEHFDRITDEIMRVESTCGSCKFWLSADCTRSNPADKDLKRYPSSDDQKCDAFTMKPGDAAFIMVKRLELMTLAGSLKA
jgi:hypothetical protein